MQPANSGGRPESRRASAWVVSSVASASSAASPPLPSRSATSASSRCRLSTFARLSSVGVWPWPRAKAVVQTISSAARKAPPALLPHCLDGIDEFRRCLLSIAVEHARVVEEKQSVLDARESRALAALDHDDIPGLVGIQDGHPVNGAGFVGAGHRVDDV